MFENREDVQEKKEEEEEDALWARFTGIAWIFMNLNNGA